MAWTYSGKPATVPIDGVRFRIGDTDPNNPLLQDETIQELLDKHNGSVLRAAIDAAEALYAMFSRYATERAGDISVDYSKRAAEYANLVKQLKAELARGARPYAGGISLSDMAQVAADSDRPPRYFKVGMMDNE